MYDQHGAMNDNIYSVGLLCNDPLVRTLYQFERSFCVGPGKEIYTVGGSGVKGGDGSPLAHVFHNKSDFSVSIQSELL